MADDGELTMTMIDGRDALFGLVVKQADDGYLGADLFGSGLPRPDAVALLRQVADRLEDPTRATTMAEQPEIKEALRVLRILEESEPLIDPLEKMHDQAEAVEYLSNALRGVLQVLQVVPRG